MSVTSGFFNSLSGDRKYDAIQISSMFDGLITDGIYNGFLESFMVTASSPASMVVTVGEGRCWFNHTWTLNDAPLPLTLDVGDVVLNRIDTIVIDVDSTDTVRACTIKVVKGTPSSQAVAPSLENTETHHQYPLCDISVVAGATTVTQSNITNRRGTSDCPFVATLMTTVTVDELLVQWESQWDDWMTDRADAMDTWTAEQQEAFTTWFQTVQDTLDEDTAGNLYNLITNNTGINATATHAEGVVAITATGNPVNIVFLAPSDWAEADTYTYNGTPVELVDLLGEPVEDAWVQGSPVSLTITGGKAFFKNGGGRYKPTDLPPLNPNFTMEISEGDSEDTVTVTADKLTISPTTDMLAGGQWEYGTEMSPAPGKGQNIKHWTREQLVVPEDPSLSAQTVSTLAEGKSSSFTEGVQLSDILPSTAAMETRVKIPESDGELHDYLYLSANYNGTGRGLVQRAHTLDTDVTYAHNVFDYANSAVKTTVENWERTGLDASVSALIEAITIPYASSGSYSATLKSLSARVFPLSGWDLGGNFYSSAATGTALPYYTSDARRQLTDDTGAQKAYWTRDGGTYHSSEYRFVYAAVQGTLAEIAGPTAGVSVAPAFTLPLDTWFGVDEEGNYVFVGTEPPDTGPVITFSFTVPHGTQPVVRQYTYNYEEHYQTMLEGGVLPALGGDTGPTYSEVLAENTWAQIAQAVADKDPILDVWQVGDTKDEVIAGETLTFAIMGKNMDDLADGSGKAGLTFGMTQLMASTRQMNSWDTNSGSFAGSAMYSRLSGTIYPNLPTELKDAIKAVNKKTYSRGDFSKIRTDSMYLWLFSEIEVFGKATYSFAGEGTQYPYFATAAERIKRLSNGAGAASYWWERSPRNQISTSFCYVTPSGEANSRRASNSYGVCFGFCI